MLTTSIWNVRITKNILTAEKGQPFCVSTWLPMYSNIKLSCSSPPCTFSLFHLKCQFIPGSMLSALPLLHMYCRIHFLFLLCHPSLYFLFLIFLFLLPLSLSLYRLPLAYFLPRSFAFVLMFSSSLTHFMLQRSYFYFSLTLPATLSFSFFLFSSPGLGIAFSSAA